MPKFRDIPRFTEAGNWECDFSLDQAYQFIKDNTSGKRYGSKLDIDPDFQRHHVWDQTQQIQWIEFILRGGKTGRVLYLNHPGWQDHFKGDFVLVDGKQRVEAIRRFMENEIKVFDHFFREYEDDLSINLSTIKINVNNLQTKEQVLQWYIEMNAGGTPHTAQEIDKVKKMLRKIRHA